jgi:hypothetical protein
MTAIGSRSNKTRYAILAVFGVILVIVVIFLIEPAIIIQNVTVSGNVGTTGTGTTPSGISFSTNGQSYSAPVISGTYSISLPNGHDFTVTITYKLLGVSGTCQANSFNLVSYSGSASFSAIC